VDPEVILAGESNTASGSTGWNRVAVAGIVLAGILVVRIITWRCANDPSVPFLSEQEGPWVVYALPPILEARQACSRWTRFRTTLALTAVPESTVVELGAFRRYELRINGEQVATGPGKNRSWKHVHRHVVTQALRIGQNEIEVEVVNDRGPPALWLILRAGPHVLRTGEGWQACTEDGPWKPVRLAAEPMQHQITDTSPTVVAAWRTVWPLQILWLVVALGVTAAGWWWSTRGLGLPSPGAIDGAGRPRTRADVPLLVIALVLWLILCTNNLLRLPPVVGFDAPSHYEYLAFLMTHHRLPLATDGWEMYQPPLYYVVTACLMALGRWVGWTAADAAVPRLVSMLCGLGQVVLVWLVLRLMFPESLRARAVGLLLAAALPMNLYMSHYPSNEVASVALVTGAIVLTLRIIRDRSAVWWRYAMLGAVLGLGMLAKHTALLAVVAILVVLAGHLRQYHERPWRVWPRTVGIALAAMLLVAGWFGVRNWVHFRNPLVGNWDRASGFAWWQDPGYQTAGYYLRFGRSFTRPFHSAMYSYADGIYSTVWGDGMCAGISNASFRPPWHYELMAVGYPLAVFPTILIGVGFLVAVVRWMRRPTAQWTVLMGHGVLVGLAVFHMTLKLPYYGQAKGFYGLTAMACLCALGAMGFDRLARLLGRAGALLWVPLLVWAINVYASFFVWPLDAKAHRDLGEVFSYQDMPDRGVSHYRKALQLDPTLQGVAARLGALLTRLHRYAEARQTLQEGLTHTPADPELMNNLAWLLATCPVDEIRNGAEALRLAEQACRIAGHSNPTLLDTLAAAQAEVGDFPAAVQTLNRAIRLAEPAAPPGLLDGLRSRLATYQTRKPYRQPRF